MLKDMYEDILRHRSDNEENNRRCEVGQNFRKKKKAEVTITRKFMEKRWQQVRVGQIVKVKENQYFPCDMVLLNSSLPKGVCYVETKNLDGETNLKHKKAATECAERSTTAADVLDKFNESDIECDKPNEFIY